MSVRVVRPRSLRLAALAGAQLVAWGVLYYGVLVAVPAMAAETEWSEAEIFIAITGGLLVSAACAFPVGRWLDDRPRRVMVAGAALGAIALTVAALAPNILVFGGAWLLCGVAQSAVLYQAAFTVLTRRYGERRRGPLTMVTLVGGLASAVFAPLVATLLVNAGWRMTFLILAGILAATTLPVYAVTIESRWQHSVAAPPPGGDVRALLRSGRFWRLSSSFTLLSFGLYAVTLAAVPAAVQKGVDLPAAAWVLGVIGIGQVLGRLAYLAVPWREVPWLPVVTVGGFGAIIVVPFALVAGPFWLVLVIAAAVGAVRGAMTLVQASAVADRWGTASFGRLNGALSSPVTAAAALAPAAGAVLADALGSYAAMGLVMAAVCGVGALLAVRT